MDLKIKNKVAVITGGDSGIGMETAALLAAEGVRIVLSDREEDKVEQAAAALRKKYLVLKFMPCSAT